jgi:VIT1/CCC1 family predicted Fe2+/Mn2+ transporter
VALIGGFAYGAARFFGEREEIKHNHPQLAFHEAEKEAELMNAIGIDTELTSDMQAQMEQERKMWLNEVEDNEMGWEHYDESRALKSGVQTAFGFFIGGLTVCLPFCFSNSDLLYLIFPCVYYLVLLFLFGWIKGKILGIKPLRTALQLASRGFILLVFAIIVLAFISYPKVYSMMGDETSSTNMPP